MKPVKVNTLAACIAAIGFSPIIYAADNTPTVILDTVTVKGTRNKDEIGKNRVYTREVVNLYKSKNEVETFKGNTVSDLLSGMSGVYSGDARNSGALDPNIRGVQGQGRIPVTIDGTEQAITVWRGYAGANNRNYVDPNIISSVSIEKGPSFSRDMKSGIGGSVALKTIDADDIVPEGQKYGFEVKAEASNNSIKQRANVYEKSVDYRTLDAPAVALGGIWRAMLDDTDRIDQRFNGRNKFGKDKAYRIAAATKQDNFDAMLAYAYRSKGNYFSGKKGAERYGYIGPWTMETVNELNRRIADAAARGEKFYGSENMLGSPDIAKIGLFYHPGGEVTNTSLETKSWVGKTTFRLPNHQTLKFGLRHTDAIFGEIMPSRVIGPIYATPVLKIIAMAVLIASAYFKPPMSAPKMSVLYRITESIGRWSMIDIFVIIILMSSFHTNMARVVPGGAAVYFCLVVVLTMLSAYYFDPRLIWDRHQQLSDDPDSDDNQKQ